MGAHRVTDCRERVVCGGCGFQRLHGKAGRVPGAGRVISGRWRSARSMGLQSTELKALEGLEGHSPVACETHLNPPRKLGCCLLSLEPGWEVQAIWNWVVCYTVVNTQRILIRNTCSLCFTKLFLNHSAFLSSQQPCKVGRATILPLLYKWDNWGPERLSWSRSHSELVSEPLTGTYTSLLAN